MVNGGDGGDGNDCTKDRNLGSLTLSMYLPLLSYPGGLNIFANLGCSQRNSWKRNKFMRRNRCSNFQELVIYLQREMVIKLGLFVNL